MPKYCKVYLRNKKQSNISYPLRFSFLRSVFVDKMSVKQAALKWKIHYSSAKIIAREARCGKMQQMFKEYPKPTACCGWKELAEDTTPSKTKICQKDNSVFDSTDSLPSQHVEPFHENKIQITSTIGWSYLLVGN